MTTTVTLFDPTARPGEPHGAAARPTFKGFAGAVVGFIDNAKPNFGLLADDLGELLKARYGVARIVKRRKPAASIPARHEVIEALTEECDVVIAGSGD